MQKFADLFRKSLYVAQWLGRRLDGDFTRGEEEGSGGQEAAAQGSWGLFSCCQSMDTHMYVSRAPLNFNGLRPTRKCDELALGGASFKNPWAATLIYSTSSFLGAYTKLQTTFLLAQTSYDTIPTKALPDDHILHHRN